MVTKSLQDSYLLFTKRRIEQAVYEHRVIPEAPFPRTLLLGSS